MGFHSPLIRPYLLGGGSFGGGTLDSHDSWSKRVVDVGPIKKAANTLVETQI